MEQNLDILRQEIVDKSLEAFREGLFSGTSGNMSCRVAPDEMLITPTSVRYDVLRAQDIVRMKLDGTVLEGGLQPSSEWRMHAAVYKAYGETNAVFHTHSPYATAFAVVRKSIPAVLIESSIFLGGDIRCAPYTMPGSQEMADTVAQALEGRMGALIANHGAVAMGRTLPEALTAAVVLEKTAQVWIDAQALGGAVEISAEDCVFFHDFFFHKYGQK